LTDTLQAEAQTKDHTEKGPRFAGIQFLPDRLCHSEIDFLKARKHMEHIQPHNQHKNAGKNGNNRFRYTGKTDYRTDGSYNSANHGIGILLF